MPSTRSLALAALLLAAPVVVRAQAPLPAHRQLITVQPLTTIAGVISGDYEHALGTSGLTLGAGASYFDDNTIGGDPGEIGMTYASAEAKLRYYFSGTAFRGFSIGATVGGARARATAKSDFEANGTVSGPKIGTELDYTWLLGARDRLAVAAGVGAKRVFYSAKSDGYDSGMIQGAYPTVRLAVGWAF